MEDEDKNSKSLVRITRVGSTPTTGIKNSFKLRLGAVFYFAGVRGQTEQQGCFCDFFSKT